MRHIAKSLQMLLNSVLFSWFSLCAFSTPALATTAVEFYNAGINHYFMTASPDEATSLDNKPSWGWARTGRTFDVSLTHASAPSSASPVCRFYGVFSNSTVGSHFYTVDTAECAYVKSRLDWGWGYEGDAFYAVKPTGGACPSGIFPIYRAFNNSMGGAPNHRYMASQTGVDTMVSQGWSNEGVVMCAPLCTAPEVWNGTACTVASSAQALTLIAGTVDSPGSTDGPLLSASFNTPRSMTRDAQGNIYVADGCTGWYDSHALIRKISPAGVVTTIAGSKSFGGSSQDGVSNHSCWAITAHPDGNLYAFDGMNNVVRRITPQGQVTTIAGAADQSGSSDSLGAAARFNGFTISGITADQQGNLFVADIENHTIRKIDASGNVTTYAGQAGVSGSADGNLQSARFNEPLAIKADSSGGLYVADHNGIRTISNGTVSTPIPMQQLMQDLMDCGQCNDVPTGLDVSTDGRIAVASANSHAVGIYQNNSLLVKLGNGKFSSDDNTDIDGTPSASRFWAPSGVAFLANGELLISDMWNHNIRRYSASTNLVSLYAGQRFYFYPVNGVGSAAKLHNPWGLHLASSGDIWFNQGGVRKSSSSGNVMSFSNTTNEVYVLKVNNDGSFIATGRGEWTSNSHPSAIKLYGQTGAELSTLVTLSDSIPFPFYSAVGANGDIFFTNKTGGIRKYSGGVVTEFAQPIPSACCGLSGLAVTKTGSIVASDGCTIYNISASGASTPMTATQSPCDYQDGAVANARFKFIRGLAVGANGEIYVSDLGNSVIRRIYNGNVDTIAGTYRVNETKIGTGSGSFYDLRDIAYDAASNSLIIMTGNALLRAQLP